MDTLRFVIVGHVDHGKSTLIGRLLYDTDSLPSDRIEEIKKTSKDLGREPEFAYLLDCLEEERQQGITIDTTQVFFKMDRREYVIIDAPGHVEFVKNMITGASQAEAAVLIIDAREGVREQTKRHAYLLSLLGLNQVIVVLNKMDLVNFRESKFKEVKASIEKFLDSISVKQVFCIPICAMSGDNVAAKSGKMDWYKGPTFLESLDALESRQSSEDKPLVFPVQDVYRIGDKRIVVGRIEAGMLETGCSVKILPGGRVTTIDSIEKYMAKEDNACAGESVGITLRDSSFLGRGDVICSPGEEPVLSDVFSASIFWMAKQDLVKGQRMVLRCATQETTCTVETIKRRIDSATLEIIQEDAEFLRNLEVGEAIVRAKKPIAIKTFNDVQELGRFVLVQDDNICAGGIITKSPKLAEL
jgi:sulfate adenylyltransferase large subunit